MLITILCNSEDNWYVPFAKQLNIELNNLGHNIKIIYNHKELEKGDVCFVLSYTRLLNKQYLSLHNNNIVVHASNLPSGKGFSPLQWQILEGKNEIVLTLFEVVEALDAGPYYLKGNVKYNGTELLDELRLKMANKINEMCIEFITSYESLTPKIQDGVETYYSRRTDFDDEINILKPIVEQFNHFRIADNENHPLYFWHLGKKYCLKIYDVEQI